jgi:N-acetylmuramic acid 6-phosphate etherase
VSDPEPRTEAVNAATRGLDRLSSLDLVSAIYREQVAAAVAIEAALPAIARAADRIAAALESGGSLHYFGAGTSGRLGALDAAECPPTFSTPPGMVQAHIAGGPAAMSAAVEGAEDDAAAGEARAARALRAGDAAIGISASGSARFVIAAVARARGAGAVTFALTADGASPLARAAEHAIVVASGPEALAGSTRLGAGTVQKIVLGTLSTAIMVRLGRVYDNLMVDVSATNAKLRRRAQRLVRELTSLEEAPAAELLERAGGSVKVAVVMQRCALDAPAARDRLASARGSLRAALGER